MKALLTDSTRGDPDPWIESLPEQSVKPPHSLPSHGRIRKLILIENFLEFKKLLPRVLDPVIVCTGESDALYFFQINERKAGKSGFV